MKAEYGYSWGYFKVNKEGDGATVERSIALESGCLTSVLALCFQILPVAALMGVSFLNTAVFSFNLGNGSVRKK